MITVDEINMAWQPDLTLAQVMAGLEDGQMYAVVRLNGKPISRPNFGATPVADGDVIQTLPLIAGG